MERWMAHDGAGPSANASSPVLNYAACTRVRPSQRAHPNTRHSQTRLERCGISRETCSTATAESSGARFNCSMTVERWYGDALLGHCDESAARFIVPTANGADISLRSLAGLAMYLRCGAKRMCVCVGMCDRTSAHTHED